MIGKEKQEGNIEKPKKTSMAILRLQKDLQVFQSNKLHYATLQFPDANKIQQIIITLKLELNEEDAFNSKIPYNHTKIKFSLSFPDTYPIDPPKLKCLNKIYHPNINYNGSVCLPLVREDWSPTVSLQQIVYGLTFLMMYPNGDDALDPEIGDQMKKDYKLYEKIVEHTSEGRVFRQKQFDNIRSK